MTEHAGKNSQVPKNSKLLRVLFILIAVPVVLLVARSASIMMTQRRTIEENWVRYVRQLAWYGATRFDRAGSVDNLRDFLAMLQDRGYERILERLSGREVPRARGRDRADDMSGKFIPGFLAYINRDGTFIAGSGQSEVLSSLWSKYPEQEPALDGMELTSGDRHEEIAYTLCVWPTQNPDVVAVAAVTLNAWGVSRSPRTRFVYETMFAALFCLVVLFLLRKVLIRPLRSLFSGLRAFEWGKEAPKFDADEGKFMGLQVEEIASLRSAISELAREAIEKRELERRYVGDIVKAQEDERNRLAREIHDGPLQSVAALIQRVQMASLGGVNPLQEQLALAEEAAQNAVEDLRGICDSLVPPWVSLGLARCMEETASRLTRQYDVTVETDIDSDIDLPQDKTLALFRIFQEGVSNAVRHGRAAHIRLSVSRAQSGVLFVLRDDGAGFEASAASMEELYASGRRGLAGMRQRVESFGGTFTVVSAPGEGAVVEVRF